MSSFGPIQSVIPDNFRQPFLSIFYIWIIEHSDSERTSYTHPFSLKRMSLPSRTRFSSSRTSSELLVEVEDTLYRACQEKKRVHE